MRSGVALLTLLAWSATLVGQEVQAPQTAFDVVSIKPSASGAAGDGFRVNASGRVEWTNITLRRLLGMAYQRFGFDPRESSAARRGSIPIASM